MKKEYSLPKYFINRELSWLEFNERVLEEAKDNNNPLFERLKFASIASSNLDEFFMTRVATLKDMAVAKVEKLDAAGLTPTEQLKKISLRVHKMVCDQYSCYNRSLKQSLKKEDIIFFKPNDLNIEQKQYIDDYYLKYIYPVLTPMVVDKSRPFPLVLNKTLNLAVLLKEKVKKEHNVFGTIQVPSVLERVINIPNESSKRAFIFLEDIIKMNINTLFSGHDVLAMGCYRITRNSDLGLDEEEAVDLLEAVEESLKHRKWGSAIRLEFINGMASELLNVLKKELELSEEETYKINGPLDLTFLMKLNNLEGFEKLKYEPIKPQNPIEFSENKDMFDVISKGDVLLHHVYESFDPVVNLVKKAAIDPDVLAIKQTLYRVSEGITVRSIVGRFLEHSRIYYFYNDGNESIYLSSADLMHRNLNRRVELLFPIEDKKAREKVKSILDISLKDTVKARLLNSDGTYVRIDKRHKEIIESQMYFYNKAVENNTVLMNLNEDTIFKVVSNFSDEVAVG